MPLIKGGSKGGKGGDCPPPLAKKKERGKRMERKKEK